MFEHGYALLIGVDENKRPALALPIVEKDIKALDAVFTHPQCCGYRRDNVRSITGPDATAKGIRDGLTWLKEKLDADASTDQTAFIYYSGHGHREPDGKAFLIPFDIGSPFRDHAIPATELAAWIAALQPRRLLVVLDCCQAGAFDVKDTPPVELNASAVSLTSDGFAALVQGAARAVLSSSTGDQKSYIRTDKKMSVFTYHLVEALTGHAEGAETGSVTVAAVMTHVESRVPTTALAEQQQPQTPVFSYAGTTFPIALVLGGKGVAKGDPAPDPLSVLVRAELTNAKVQGEATNLDVEISGKRGATLDAKATGITVEPNGNFKNVKVKID